jgi:glycosyltransferase involved in cell wall biosynthesis
VPSVGSPGGISADRPVTVIVPLPPSYRGGTEEYAYRVAVRVGRSLPSRIVTTRVRFGHDPHPLPTDDLPIEYLPGRELFQRPVVGTEGLARLRRAVEGSGLVHLHMPFPRVEARVVRWARARGIPVVLTYHMDADFAGASGVPGAGLVTWAYRRLSAFPALEGASAVVSNSQGYAKASPVLSRYLPTVRVIYKGVDVDRLGLEVAGTQAPVRPAPDPEIFPRCAPETRRVVFVGRMVPYKGVRYLISAVGELTRSGTDVKLFLAGRGPELANLREQARREHVEDGVEFLGFVPDPKLGALYAGADVVACPSTNLMESSATCLEEAAAVGVPVLGSALPGAEETIPNDGAHGLLVPPRDARAVTEGLRRLLGRSRPRERLPFRRWEETADRYLELFRTLARSDPHGRPGEGA